jgi:hypothetical protein
MRAALAALLLAAVGVVASTLPAQAATTVVAYEGLIKDWRDQMLGALLPPDEAHDYRRHDLLVMEAHGQGIYDITDPRHPQRWFDRDDLREQCASSLAYVRMSQDEQAAHTKEAMARLDKDLTAKSA